MSRLRLELVAVIAVVGVSAAFFASAPEPEEMSPTPRVTASVRPGQPVGEPSWGDNPCVVDLHEGQLNLIFKNDGLSDYHLYTGGGYVRFQVVKATPKQIVVAAVYSGCVADYVHNCYHHAIFNVPAGQTRTMHLGKAPKSMKSFPAHVPGMYRTASPAKSR